MTLTINEIIKSVFHAMEKEGISLSKSEYTLIEKEATKIIESLLKLNNKNKIYTKFSVRIPCDIIKLHFEIKQ